MGKRLKRLLRDAMRLHGVRDSMCAEEYASKCLRMENRLTMLLNESW